jgi:alpha-glucosidase
VDGGELLAGARVLDERSRAVDERVRVWFGKSTEARDRFTERRWTLETRKRSHVEVVFRCYDDAVAFRYELSAGAEFKSVVISNESTSFGVEGEPSALVQYLENFRTSHEHNVTQVPWREIRRGGLVDLPLTLFWQDDTSVAITEASLRNYAGMALMRPAVGEQGDTLVAQLTPRADGTKVVRPLPMQTPWRVAMIGNRPGALLESQTLYLLNEPSVIEDTSWIKPGKITFHWWNGDVFDGQPGPAILSVEMAKRYIDFCASNNIAAHSLTSTENTTTPWYQQSKPGVEPGPDTDVTRPREGFDLWAIRQYAESKGVRLWTWVHQGALRGRVEEAFSAFEKLGWSGMMVDFFDHDDQDTVEFAESILAAAARHHILIHFHGIWKPTGWQRTYPNLMNHEGALNLEYHKWSARCTPEHDLMMAFTRLIAGPMDYHLGGFRAVPRSEFKPRNVAPNVLGTRGHMLGMYVCFDNPMPMVADFPTAYEGQAGFDFLKRVPTWWDETRVPIARVGELLVTARRSGGTWYLGGLSAKAIPNLRVPLTFLPPGRFQATIWRDDTNPADDPNRLVIETFIVLSTNVLQVETADGGGFVAELVPLRERPDVRSREGEADAGSYRESKRG